MLFQACITVVLWMIAADVVLADMVSELTARTHRDSRSAQPFEKRLLPRGGSGKLFDGPFAYQWQNEALLAM
jgi:hypothetical protein